MWYIREGVPLPAGQTTTTGDRVETEGENTAYHGGEVAESV